MKVEIWEVTLLITYILAMLGLMFDNPKTILVAIFLVIGNFYHCWRKKNETE